MSKLVNPWMCDNPSCGMLRAHDTNHWLVILPMRWCAIERTEPMVAIRPWSERAAQWEGAKHACGIDCALRIVSALLAENFFGDSK